MKKQYNMIYNLETGKVKLSILIKCYFFILQYNFNQTSACAAAPTGQGNSNCACSSANVDYYLRAQVLLRIKGIAIVCVPVQI